MTCVTCMIITCNGRAVQLVDADLLAKPTRRLKPWRTRHILDELRVAAEQDRVGGGV